MTQSLKVDTSVKGIILLTLPISLARLVPELNFLVNAIFLGHLGTKELAYAALTGVYYLIFAAMGYGLSNAILSMISRQAGENNRNNIINTLRHGYIVAAILAGTAFVITYLLLEGLLASLGVVPADAAVVADFLYIRIVGLFFLFGYQLSNSYIICIQETRWLLFASVIESVANIVLDYWFIFGGPGVEAMGFNGAAYASVISEIVGFAAVGFLIINKKFGLKYDIPARFSYSFKLLKKTFYQASPLMAQYAISIIAWWIFYILINRHYSYEEQAASQAMRNLFGISGVFSWAFGATTNTVLSNLLGQGKNNQFMPALKRIMFISTSGMLFFILLVNIAPGAVFAIYGQAEQFSAVGTSLLRVVTSAMLMLTISVIWLNAVVATGNTRFVFLTELVSILAYLIYVYYVIEILQLSVSAAWMSEWLYWSVMFIMSYIYIRRWIRQSEIV